MPDVSLTKTTETTSNNKQPDVTGQNTALQWFRDAAPYINMHRGKVFVVMFSGDAVQHEYFNQLIHDISLLKILGIKLVLVHGARPQIDANLHKQNITTPIKNNLRVTTRSALPAVLDAVGSTRLKVEAQLTVGLNNTLMLGKRNDVVSGNYVIAKPYGVRDGVDFELTGTIRSIDTQAILNNLINEQIVLLGSIGYSTTGEVFNLLAEQVAVKTAIALQAEKLIFIGKQDTHVCLQKQRDFIPSSLFELLQAQHSQLPIELRRHLTGSAKACEQGVGRAHIVSHENSDSLLTELFTRDGSGLMISSDPFEEIQAAQISDVGGLIALLTPLEEKGILVKRSREKLEREINHFVVAKRDGMIVGCAALYPLAHAESEQSLREAASMAEIACVAVHPGYRNENRGEKLLQFLEKRSVEQGIATLFVLTTQTAHWFLEQGFLETSLDELPLHKQKLYNKQRNSKIYSKKLTPA